MFKVNLSQNKNNNNNNELMLPTAELLSALMGILPVVFGFFGSAWRSEIPLHVPESITVIPVT